MQLPSCARFGRARAPVPTRAVSLVCSFDNLPCLHVTSIFGDQSLFRFGGRMKSRLISIQTFVICIMLCSIAVSQDLASFEKRTTVKKLANGLTIIICERPEAPVFSFFTHVDAGSVQDPMGKTGLAHMFEHMAFKGTDTIGTRDYSAEKVALEKVEKAYAAYRYERDKRVGRDDAKVKQLEKAWQDAVQEANQYVIPN